MLTALTHHLDRISGREAGADDFLVKPIVTQELLYTVRNAVRSRRALDALQQRCESLEVFRAAVSERIGWLLGNQDSPLRLLRESLALAADGDFRPKKALTRWDLTRDELTLLAELAEQAAPKSEAEEPQPRIGILRPR
jgi:DNA-binding response OmpR family regulator